MVFTEYKTLETEPWIAESQILMSIYTPLINIKLIKNDSFVEFYTNGNLINMAICTSKLNAKREGEKKKNNVTVSSLSSIRLEARSSWKFGTF